MMMVLRSRALIYQTVLFFSIVILVIVALRTSSVQDSLSRFKTNNIDPIITHEEKGPPHPKYKPTPSYIAPPISDPFPALATSTPPPIPPYNVPEKDGWKKYGLEIAPPLVIGFTRSWPMLLQTVVSYITAGWPPEQIYVVENTGMQQANARGQLTLQHPFYLNHTTLKNKLGINIIQTPVLLTFAQLQNFYLSLSYTHEWPYYFWSHMDVLALGHENGFENLTARAGEPGYKSLYTLCLEELNHTLATDDRWGLRFFAYDHLTLQNPRALEDINGWDTLIPYYMTDCDTYTRLTMRNWSQIDANCGVVTDTSVALDDLLALYRDPKITPKFTDPNPPPPAEDDGEIKERRHLASKRESIEELVEYWKALIKVADSMFHYKHGERGRNTWQAGQHGGQGEPFYYDSAGFSEAIEVLTEAGKEVYRRKWGHRDCDLISGAGVKYEDQWKVLQDW
ncbi:hypothetical protein F5B22DRAFT_204882 [Xylaria bambusicola]|uniref:uncharacterized protein n=1 Tax=Xylaria bambusicola TaxID=326684 RepID=UPI0020083ED8|nr:uncharacterized protein F5B22DRAFT_204882 [Xylaria bambusicola]KAI0515159.1 hypothetical protein F5B22DRAFT_204882 [Xylaria bambusicola]